MKLTHRFACIPAALLALCMLLSVLCTLPLPITAASGAFSQWKTDGWTESTEDGTPVLTANANQSINVLYLNGVAEGNNLSFSIRMNDSYGTVDGNIGAAYKCATGDQYFFEYNLARSFSGGAQTVIKQFDGDFKTGEWMDMAVRGQNGQCLWYIDGELFLSYEVEDRAAAPIALVAYNITCAIKDLKIAPAGTTLITGDEVIPEETEPEETQPDESQPEETDPDSDPVVDTDPETPTDTAPATEKPDDGEGCASTVGVGALLSVTVTAAAMTARRKQEEQTE